MPNHHVELYNFYKHNGKQWTCLRDYKIGDVICNIMPINPLDEIQAHLILELEKGRGNLYTAYLLNVRVKDNIFFCEQTLNTESINIKYLGKLYGINCYQILECKNDILNTNFIVSGNSKEGINEVNNNNG